MMNNMMEMRASDVVPNAQTQALIGRQSQEVQAAVFMAKQFPRNEQTSIERCLRAAQRQSLAQVAVYEYPRGGTRVTGASIRLAEAIAQNWGNIDTGVVELERRNGESTAMAYAWDLETNYRQTKTFTVKHVRETRKGVQVLTDSRDIYELIANQGARRQRACILGVIPGDVVEMTLKECEKTLSSNQMPLGDRIREMVQFFKSEYGVTVQQLEAYAGMNIDAFSERQYMMFVKIHNSIKDGMKRVEDYFTEEEMPQQKTISKQAKGPQNNVSPQNPQEIRTPDNAWQTIDGQPIDRPPQQAPHGGGQVDMSQLMGSGGQDQDGVGRFQRMEQEGKFDDL